MEQQRPPLRLLISGCRELGQFKPEAIQMYLGPLLKSSAPVVVIHGGARGVDALVEEMCKRMGVPTVVFKPYFVVDQNGEFSPRHYFMRNKQMVDNCDSAIIFDNGEDSGTRDLINRLDRSRKQYTSFFAPTQETDMEVTPDVP